MELISTSIRPVQMPRCQCSAPAQALTAYFGLQLSNFLQIDLGPVRELLYLLVVRCTHAQTSASAEQPPCKRLRVRKPREELVQQCRDQVLERLQLNLDLADVVLSAPCALQGQHPEVHSLNQL